MEKQYKCYIVFQTHWDREWYFPFEVFRYRFIHVMDRILKGLDSNEIKQFVLDGQMAALEDYLEVCEHAKADQVKNYIKEDRIIIGPWYVLADEFLVSGESLIRNIEIGLKLANQYGKPQNVGYLPDTFGHVSQMPQLLKGFNINNTILWRGIKPEQSEFKWKAPDGSEILTVFLPEGYYQPLLNEDDYISKMKDYVEKIKPYATTDALLLTNGGDHLMPVFHHMKERIEELNEAIEHTEFIQSSYENYINSIEEKAQNLSVYEGEMRSNEHIYVLPNVLSTRVYLKQQNQKMEDELVGYTEPLLALASLKSDAFPHVFLEDSWKLLLQNHPHDSICGCSVDEVHDEMETRTEKLSQRLYMLQQDALLKLGIADPAATGTAARKPFSDDEQFVVFNPHLTPYNGWVKGKLFLHEEKEFVLKDLKGNTYQPVILNSYKGRKFESPLDAFPDFKHGTYYEVAIQVEKLPAFSLTGFSVVKGQTLVIASSESSTIENEFVKVNVEETGVLTVSHKNSGKEYNGFLQMYSSLDAGDEYNYSPPVNDILTFAKLVGKPKVEKNPSYQRLKYQVELKLPASLNDDRTGASSDTVTNKATITMELFTGDSKVYTHLKLENKAKDQRLRMKFPLSTTISTSYSDTAFDVVKREAKKEEQFDAPKQKEVPVVVEPSTSFIKAENFAFYHRGLQEYQITANDEVEVTLLRSVGWLSRDDLRTRGGGAGPNMATPKGQCIGTYEYDFAFDFEDKAIPEIVKSAHQFRVPPRFYTGHVNDLSLQNIIEINSDVIQWSSVKVNEGKLVVRLYNPIHQPEMVTFSSSREMVTINKVNFNGDLLQKLNSFEARINGKEIATYEITFNKGEQ
ncbi:alpha-mannosidase/mannosylglycerate hydrolase [Bacillus mesophilus]|uniref:Glycoside hydrolase family 38 n=1 Tax=Bacillus mesophilus TaxID=1808955 RepID=A0A6M0QBL1_9BACI|nr:glycoside hydrolase family 38 C-terminal domain-containing protein [Bacillus mesophilus]MBM7661760.1 alpha-mannosidase/mannosylglycerate hydrolase [Bacillus mesophilus]NEY72418.1 glycoside hydrolase family 38 [Bacillus mesophilus]